MLITNTHLRYWQARQRLPRWALSLPRGQQASETIHHCINAHAGERAKYLEAGNTLNLVRMVRARGESVQIYLMTLASPTSWCAYNCKRRHAYARKWARMIEVRRRIA